MEVSCANSLAHLPVLRCPLAILCRCRETDKSKVRLRHFVTVFMQHSFHGPDIRILPRYLVYAGLRIFLRLYFMVIVPITCLKFISLCLFGGTTRDTIRNHHTSLTAVQLLRFYTQLVRRAEIYCRRHSYYVLSVVHRFRGAAVSDFLHNLSILNNQIS